MSGLAGEAGSLGGQALLKEADFLLIDGLEFFPAKGVQKSEDALGDIMAVGSEHFLGLVNLVAGLAELVLSDKLVGGQTGQQLLLGDFLGQADPAFDFLS